LFRALLTGVVVLPKLFVLIVHVVLGPHARDASAVGTVTVFRARTTQGRVGFMTTLITVGVIASTTRTGKSIPRLLWKKKTRKISLWHLLV